MGLPDPVTIQGADGRVIEVRPATPSDAGSWLTLLHQVAAEGRFLALENITFNKRQLARHFKTYAWSEAHGAIAAISDGKVIGQISLYRELGIYRHVAELGMSVAQAFRKQGVGTALIKAAIEWARRFEVDKLQLNVFPHNERAIQLYEKMGFVAEGLRKRQAKLTYGYEDLVPMSLWVADVAWDQPVSPRE